MNRRDFSALLPMLLAAPALAPAAEAQSPAPAALPKLTSGPYIWGEAYGTQRPARTSHRFLMGMLPDNIRLESHVTFLVPGAPAEPVEHHKHSEIWLVREGTVTLMAAGVDHWVTNASKTESASYFVLAVGPPE